jgi:hypothetical protein
MYLLSKKCKKFACKMLKNFQIFFKQYFYEIPVANNKKCPFSLLKKDFSQKILIGVIFLLLK